MNERIDYTYEEIKAMKEAADEAGDTDTKNVLQGILDNYDADRYAKEAEDL